MLRTIRTGLLSTALLLMGSAPAASAHTLPLFHDTVTSNATFSPKQVSSAYTPSDLRTAYDFTPLYDHTITGKGQTVALVEVDALNKSDVTQFDDEFGLPAPNITETMVGAHSFTLSRSPETDMDVEWLHALAPGAAIHIYYINNSQSVSSGWKTLAQTLKQAATDGAKTISLSFGACSPSGGGTAVETELATLMKQKVSVFVSSGDNGIHPGSQRQCGKQVGVAYPGSDPSVVSVGGTSVQLNDNGTLSDEVAWDSSGGGQTTFTRKSWQTAPTMTADTHRWAPDVAFLADLATGVDVVYRGRDEVMGGTSLGAPAWAAIWSLVLQDAQNTGLTLRAAPRTIYTVGNSASYSTAFHDITDGSNGKYTAGTGWDAVTGWGSPDVAAFDTAAKATVSTP